MHVEHVCHSVKKRTQTSSDLESVEIRSGLYYEETLHIVQDIGSAFKLEVTT